MSRIESPRPPSPLGSVGLFRSNFSQSPISSNDVGIEREKTLGYPCPDAKICDEVERRLSKTVLPVSTYLSGLAFTVTLLS